MLVLRNVAQEYFGKGMNVVTVRQKKPLVEWAQWETRRQTLEEFEAQPWREADGFAVVCGTKLENGLFLAAVDFDVKNVSEEAKTNGVQILKQLLTTQIEETPSGGQHWLYLCYNKSRTANMYHNQCGLELLGKGKLCIMAPSQGYKRLNDNPLTAVKDLEQLLLEAMWKAGFKPVISEKDGWFDRQETNGKWFSGKTPPCIEALYNGASQGERNEYAIRLASFLLNFRKTRADHVLEQMRKINRLNDPPLGDLELQSIVKNAVNGGYVYGCQDTILKRNCNRDECPIPPVNLAKTLSKEETEKAERLLNEAKLLEYSLIYGKRRLIGEDNAILANFVMFCSARTRYMISSVVSGFSGSGKNESIRAIKPLLPKEWYFEFTTSTPEAIKYLPEDFEGTLIIYEATGVRGDSGSLALRAIGEGESIETIYPMRNELTGKMEMGRAKTNAKNFITTSSDIDINPDLYRRVLKYTMNHSTQLTKRVIAKKLRDASYPESLKNKLGLQNGLHFDEKDFQNALRLLDWKLEAIVFTPTELMGVLDLAVKREQEVALRTHVEKIINFTRTLALLNQKRRLRIKVDDLEYVFAEPQDFLKALSILQASIMETVSRIEKRQEEALKLFSNSDVSLNRNDVASKLKVSTKTATRLLKTLAQAGYLKEEINGKTYQYQLLQREPKNLNLLENIQSPDAFHRTRLAEWLKTVQTGAHVKEIPVSQYSHPQQSWLPLQSTLQNDQLSSQPATSTCPDVQGPSAAKSSLPLPKGLDDVDNCETSRLSESNCRNNEDPENNILAHLKSVYWKDGFCGWHRCAACRQTKLTGWQGETFKGEKLSLCEDCKTTWEKQEETAE